MDRSKMSATFKIFSAALLLGIGVAAAPSESFAASFYVRKGAAGSNNGTNWTDAWNEMSAINWGSVACGDTVWLAGGTYTSTLSASKNCTAGSPLSVKRVLATDAVPAAAAGWSSSYDSLVTVPAINVPGPAAYLTIDGRINYGILVLIPGTEGDGISGGAGNGSGVAQPIDHITWTHIEVYGPACVENSTCTGSGVVGIQIMPYCSGANRTNMLLDHLSVHRTGEAVRGCGWSDSIIQYSDIYDTHNDGPQHEDILYSNAPYQNVTWRYNRIWSNPNDGIFFEGSGGAVNFKFYGNTYYHSGGSLMTFKVGSSYGPVYIYNNVFENDGTFGDYQPGWLNFDGTMAAGTEIANNIFQNIDNQAGSSINSNHNAYNLSGYTETGVVHFTAGTQFGNISSGNPLLADFHLTAAGATAFANKGKALSAEFATDADGNVRGGDGTWDIGAFEYNGMPAQPAPAAPTGLTATVK
jgi:hypothetical protein